MTILYLVRMSNPEVEFDDLNINADTGEIRVIWMIPENLSYFQGHFPGNPVFPAIGAMDITLEILRRTHPERNVELKSMKSAKFLSPITPGMKLEITLTPQPRVDENTSAWRVLWKTGEQLLADLFLSLHLR